MANYDSNYAIAQEISARIGVSPIPFDSVYSIALEIYNELGGEPAEFDSVYSILLGILPLVEGGVASKVIDDNVITTVKTWSSSKINSELSGKASVDYVDEQIEAVIGAGNSDIEGKETEDFTFVQSLPVSGDEGQQVIIKGDNSDTLYKCISGEWVEQTPDATKLYFDTENEALYSYVTAEHQFAPVSLVNTIVVGSNLNSNADLKALKTVGVYNVVQRLHNATKGNYVKNWTLYVESIDYEEYDRSDSVYQRLVSNYTIQKRTWSATRATNDGWSNFSTYYAGEIKDTTTSKYYTWSSNKISSELANIPQLEAGQNVEIIDNTVSAVGYAAGKSMTSSFVELPEIVVEPYMDMSSRIPSTDLYFTGDAGATTYTVNGQLTAMLDMMVGIIAFQVGSGNIALLASYDATNSTVTLDKTLDADNALSNAQMSKLYMVIIATFSGAAGVTTYTYTDSTGGFLSAMLSDAGKIKIGDYPIAIIVSVDSTNNTITLSETLDASNAVSNAQFMYAIKQNNTASGMCSHAEGNMTTASGSCSHAEGNRTTASSSDSHAEGYSTTASGSGSHAEGNMTTASGENSHAEGDSTTASGYSSHSEGERTTASGYSSHSEGYETTAQNHTEHAEGRYNVSHKASDTYGNVGNTQHSVGIGTGENAKNNAFEIMQNADMYIKGIGGYQGTNTKVQDNTIKPLQTVISDINTSVAGKQDTLTAGSNISISGNTISATYEVATTADIEALFS